MVKECLDLRTVAGVKLNFVEKILIWTLIFIMVVFIVSVFSIHFNDIMEVIR